MSQTIFEHQNTVAQRAAAAVCAGGDPPSCCQPAEGYGGEVCPACGSDFTMPTLLARGQWGCWEPGCETVWTPDHE